MILKIHQITTLLYWVMPVSTVIILSRTRRSAAVNIVCLICIVKENCSKKQGRHTAAASTPFLPKSHLHKETQVAKKQPPFKHQVCQLKQKL